MAAVRRKLGFAEGRSLTCAAGCSCPCQALREAQALARCWDIHHTDSPDCQSWNSSVGSMQVSRRACKACGRVPGHPGPGPPGRCAPPRTPH